MSVIPGVSVLLLAEPPGGQPVLAVAADGAGGEALVEACEGAGRPVVAVEPGRGAAELRALAAAGSLAEYGLLALTSPAVSVYGRAAAASALHLPDDTISAVEIAGWALDADAVLLPGCAVESEPFPAWRVAAAWSDDVLELEEAFQAAGARAVLSPLWQADGTAAGAISRVTASLLAEGQPAPDALYAAINGYLDQAPDAAARPWEWAAFRVVRFAGADDGATQAVEPEAEEAAASPAVQPEPLPDPDAVLLDVAARVHDPAAAIYQRYVEQGEDRVVFRPAEQMVEYTALPYRPDPGDTLVLPRPVRVIVGLEVAGQVLRAGFELYGDVIVGRGESSAEGIIVDLTPYHGIEAGVSRQHMMISPGDGCVTIMDLGSTNGTSLDGVELEPYEEARLTARHRVRLSDLPLVISVVE